MLNYTVPNGQGLPHWAAHRLTHGVMKLLANLSAYELIRGLHMAVLVRPQHLYSQSVSTVPIGHLRGGFGTELPRICATVQNDFFRNGT